VIQTVGYLGSAGAAIMWVPQAFRAVRHRRDAAMLAGISTVAYVVAMAFNALLFTYGLLSDAGPVELAGCLNFLCAGVIVSVVVLSRRRAQ
jgi:uncharacterized protein with PQ loop repeat